uniref:Galactosylgalactosylxylosylprotein 3-beta-glucuronosyltransferase n=1 Tax=Caenorhabditis elegans TaxID=6239 RepID=Q4VYA8_CAEEL|nr:beta-1,3-glucuronosyltransferase [Caenorhabditis elegans]
MSNRLGGFAIRWYAVGGLFGGSEIVSSILKDDPRILNFIVTYAFRIKPTSPQDSGSNRMIIVITPTYKRITRLADITRLANTLSQVENLHWIVIEDGESTIPNVQNILERSELLYTYVAHRTASGYPARGWYQRDMALKLIRTNPSQILGEHEGEAVIYFADDDNSYDLRLFEDYIRNVKKLGLWAVGLAGGAAVEAPNVVNKKVTSFNFKWKSKRRFAVDMAGFAINLDYILNSSAVFGTECKRGDGAPETCLLEDLGEIYSSLYSMVFYLQKNNEILVWHTKTSYSGMKVKEAEKFGYFVEP